MPKPPAVLSSIIPLNCVQNTVTERRRSRDGRLYTPNHKLAAFLLYMLTGSDVHLKEITTASGAQIAIQSIRERDAVGDFSVPMRTNRLQEEDSESSFKYQSTTVPVELITFQTTSLEILLCKLVKILFLAEISDTEGNQYASGYVLATTLTYMRSGKAEDLQRITTAGHARYYVMEVRERFMRQGFVLGDHVRKFS